MPDIYSVAWKILEEKITKSRRQSISKADLMEWQLRALEAAVDRFCLEAVYAEMQHGQQEKT
ncbi:hypothetical protein LCGC14_1031340 [marine sediment metagenome]|uniref:Uncharacterized protein n=1 Tax=marine sediment metagenome TaxID=412755 RepID=A0A0F9MZ07_9ZZZZ